MPRLNPDKDFIGGPDLDPPWEEKVEPEPDDYEETTVVSKKIPQPVEPDEVEDDIDF
jgi:hypothetical protein